MARQPNYCCFVLRRKYLVNRSNRKIEIKLVQAENLLGIIRKVYERFIRIRGNPREVALGFALGVFVGMSPTIGVQTPIAIFFAALFKWSKLSAAIGVWVSNPLSAPILYGITYITGAKVLRLDPVFNLHLSPTWSMLKVLLQKAPQALAAMTVGGVILGLPLAVICYYLSYAAVEKYQEDVRDKLARQKARLADSKDKVKKKVLERKIQKGGDEDPGSEGGGQLTEDGGQMTEDRGQKTDG
jgi:uncharacterized protein (DUF2062 family)